MKSRATKKRFLKRLEEAGQTLAALAVVDGIASMLNFYAEERTEGCDLEEDGDMLLYQWGCQDWGEGEFFEVNITRQLMDGALEDEDIRQLSLTFRFKPDSKLRKLVNGNKWCTSPDEVAAFRTFIHSSQALKAVAKMKPAAITLDLGAVG